MKHLKFLCVFLMIFSFGCGKGEQLPVTIAINPWPGYEPLYLAEYKGFFNKIDANIQLVQMDSLSDVQRAYMNGHVDGMASTIIEVVQSANLNDKPLKIVMVPDYSNGGDVIIGKSDIKNVAQLKGKNIGAEVSSLGIYVLHRALIKHGLNLNDVNVVNIKQEEALQKMLNKQIDASVTYPPFSIEISAQDQFDTIFSSSEIPFEIIDTISVSETVLKQHPQFVEKLRTAWQMALDYMKTNPEDSYRIMAEREGISAEDFKLSLNDLIILDKNDQNELFKNNTKLNNAISDVCDALIQTNSLETKCSENLNLTVNY